MKGIWTWVIIIGLVVGIILVIRNLNKDNNKDRTVYDNGTTNGGYYEPTGGQQLQ